MKDLKFRIWDNQTKRYETCVYESYKDCYLFIGRYGYVTAFNCYGEEIDFEDGRFVVQQYTGLKDKNGKEIYEGDIVLYYKSTSDERPSAPVVFSPFGYGFVLDSSGRHAIGDTKYGDYNLLLHSMVTNMMYEVVGNIFENTELLT